MPRFGGMGAGSFGRMGVSGRSLTSGLSAPVLAMDPAWTSADNTPDFTIDVSGILLVAGDVVTLQVQVAGGDWSSLSANSTHILTSGELAAGTATFGISSLTNASYEARCKVTHTVDTPWSNIVSFTVSAITTRQFALVASYINSATTRQFAKAGQYVVETT